MTQFFGKYRGKVENNIDPMMLGRVQVSVPAVLGSGQLSWAMPCAPFAGPGVGLFTVPPVGANVWVEFEAGDPDYPIWSGCFWGVEDRFRQVPGVVATAVGYTGGRTATPTYETVCSHTTGHAETVLVEYDPKQVSYQRLLDIFFANHDPTTLNRQGNDVGTQYRSGIYWQEPAQEAVVREVLAEAQAAHKGRVVTEVAPRANYWRAEDYHQHYFANHPQQGYCAFVVAPKVEKFRRTFQARVRK